MEKQLLVEKAKAKKFQEKLSQERQWHEKEQSTVDKKGKEFQQLKKELSKIQEISSKEHALNLRLEKGLKELKGENDALNQKRRAVESENAQLKAKMDNYRRETAQLKKENAELNKKKEDVSWIAKSEYERVARLLKEKEMDLERIPRESGPLAEGG